MSARPHILTVIRPDGSIVKHLLDGEPTLTELQEAVGGYIEKVPEFSQYNGRPIEAAYCNEEGRNNDLPLNREASRLWRAHYPANARLWYEPQIFGAMAIVQTAD
jgi:hypothetical protein